jgi:hypothetical protein
MLLQFTTHYPDTYPNNLTDTQTSYLISQYFASNCAIPLNNSTLSLPCITYAAWFPFTITDVLNEVDLANSNLAGLTSSTSILPPAPTTQAISTALPSPVSVTVPFALFVAGIVLTILGLAFYVQPVERWLKRAMACLAAAFVAYVVGAACITTLAYAIKGKLLDGVERRFVGEAKVGVVYMALVWTAVVASGICVMSCLLHWVFWRGLSHQQRNAELEKRRMEYEEWLMNADD